MSRERESVLQHRVYKETHYILNADQFYDKNCIFLGNFLSDRLLYVYEIDELFLGRVVCVCECLINFDIRDTRLC